jgi:uncharacterized protein YjiS (DUF1127 family)
MTDANASIAHPAPALQPQNRVAFLGPSWPTTLTTVLLPRWLAAVRRMHERRRQRQDLRVLDDHLLRDIGVTHEQARREAGRPFWR